jgi:hypothetical protein
LLCRCEQPELAQHRQQYLVEPGARKPTLRTLGIPIRAPALAITLG